MFEGTTETAPQKIPHHEMPLPDGAEGSLWDVGLLNTDRCYECNSIILLRRKDGEKTKAERLWG